MKEVSAPKALNILRPIQRDKPTPTVSQSDYHLLSKRSSKITNSQIHEPGKLTTRPNTFHLYDPKKPQQLQMQLTPQHQALKKPVINLYRPHKRQSLGNLQRSQTKQLINLHLSLDSQATSVSKQQTIDIPMPEELTECDDEPSLVTDDEDSDEDDMLPEARINRKIADLEISNKSLLTINEMLESTVRHQAKQVASFKKLAMTVPNEEEQKRQQEIIQRAEDEDDWRNDEQFNRLVRMTDRLIEQAQRALTHQAETGGRVISSHYHPGNIHHDKEQ